MTSTILDIPTTSTIPTAIPGTTSTNFVPMPSLKETLQCAQPNVGWDPMDMI
eukprot:CAMPEP_0172903210 /NCGR_PEP_ID=MMETSP1075-20121228/170063_1 /TAXON_ID=2916 /ORGANISM="Ceratium fusus, Strain PA161109" /LENGTH=51 /DNA_ID=CAMNT_0013759965 /DNA_START=52 /DNA_END=204 /DNA_ORIENTATION=-